MDRHDLVVLGGGAPRATAQKLARPVVEEEGEHFAALEERRALENSSSRCGCDCPQQGSITALTTGVLHHAPNRRLV
jgi:hypothetical protein